MQFTQMPESDATVDDKMIKAFIRMRKAPTIDKQLNPHTEEPWRRALQQ
jgi:hypothetical protein